MTSDKKNFQNKGSLMNDYRCKLTEVLDKIAEEERENVLQAGKTAAKRISEEGLIHVFGTGHSHMAAEELFYRAGGLACYNPIFDPDLMLHRGARESTSRERRDGYAASVLEEYDLRDRDAMIVVSNSGVNAVPVEAALKGGELGLEVIAVTSLQYSRYASPNNNAGKKLYQVADIVIDNHLPPGDALVEVEDLGSVAPGSTVALSFILNSISLAAIEYLQEWNEKIPYYRSSNMEGASSHNQKVAERYAERIKHL